MTTIVGSLDMSKFSLSSWVPPGNGDPLSTLSISYSGGQARIFGANGGHGYLILQGDFSAEHKENEISDAAVITGFQMVGIGFTGRSTYLFVDGISATWSELTTTNTTLMKTGPLLFFGDRGNDVAYGSSRSDKFNMGAGADTVYAGGSYDEIQGGFGNDELYGGGGRDMIEGGRGNDHLTGGRGDDFFIFFGKTGRDIIEDYDGGDFLQFSKTDVHNEKAVERRTVQFDNDVHIDIADISIIIKDADKDDLDIMILNF